MRWRILDKYKVASALLVSYSKSQLKRRSQCSQLMERSTTQRVGGVKLPQFVSWVLTKYLQTYLSCPLASTGQSTSHRVLLWCEWGYAK